MRFRVLGPVEVAVEGRRLRLGSAHQRVVLAVLLVARGRTVSTDRLIEAIWAEEPPATARRSLHSHVSRLRRELVTSTPGAAGTIITADAGYRLDLARHDLDAVRFEALLDQARGLRDSEPQRALERLDEALSLWGGVAFGDLASHPLVRAEAVRLEELRATAAGDRIDALLAVGEHGAVIGELEAVIIDDPLAERPHQQLMLALYRSGRQVDALAVHRRLQQRLREEIGVDPSSQVQRLHERLLHQDPELEAPMRGVVAPEGGPPTRRGPPAGAGVGRAGDDDAHGRLLGRGQAVDEVAGLVSARPLVTLTGPGGVGKSRLAEAVVAAARGRFSDGVAVCRLAAVHDPASVGAALLDTLQLQQEGGRRSEELLAEGVGTRRLLLVVDNCEHLLSAVSELVERLRERCPNLAILATSRERLHLAEELVWQVSPLPVPPEDADPTEVAEAAASALFCVRARQIEPSFRLTEDNAATVAQLCRRLDGLPLAIELAAARVRALSLDALAQRIDHRFDLLTGGSPRDAGRHRTLHAVVEWSYDLLTDAEATLFDRLSVFAGEFTLTAAEAVGAHEPLESREIAGLLAELVEKSLVVVERDDGRVRYRLLDTLRAYGADRLRSAGATAQTRRAHAAHHVELAETLGAQVRGPDERRALIRLAAIVDDLRVAHDWTVANAEVELALRLPAAVHEELVFRPREEVFAWADRALELNGAPVSPGYPAALATAARGAMNRGDLDRARHLAETVLEVAGGHQRSTLWALYVLTTTALYEGRLAAALALADRRIALADELEDDYHRALAGVSRALAQRYRGESDAAVEAAAEARQAARASRNLTAEAWVLYSQGEAILDTEPGEAAELLRAAIVAARKVDRRFIEGVALVSLASLSGRLGETDRALALFREAVAHWRPLGAHTQQLTTLRNLVDLLVRVGADEPAAVLYGAVTAGVTPSFGAEAERLAAAWHALEGRLGRDRVEAAAMRGQTMGAAAMVDEALRLLDRLVERTQLTGGSSPQPTVRDAPPGP